MSSVFTTTKVDIPFGNSVITLEQGRVALQASGAVLVKSGETVVMVTAVTQKNPKSPWPPPPAYVRPSPSMK